MCERARMPSPRHEAPSSILCRTCQLGVTVTLAPAIVLDAAVALLGQDAIADAYDLCSVWGCLVTGFWV